MVSSVQLEPVSRSDQYKRVMKPLLERKRRARINKCLDELRDLLVSVLQSEGEAVTRLEKADILELTVRHVRKLSERRRLALPAPGVKPIDHTAVEKFQQGFVAAAQQVQTFLLATPALEPTVSSRLLSHLSSYATSISPAPPSVPIPTQAVECAPQIMVSQPHLNQMKSPVAASSNISCQQVSNSQVNIDSKTSQAHYAKSTILTPQTMSPNISSAMSSAPVQTNSHKISVKQFHVPLPPPPSNVDYRNSKTINGTFPKPVIRDVKIEDRVVAPSPFIDVVSTENDDNPLLSNKHFNSSPTYDSDTRKNSAASSDFDRDSRYQDIKKPLTETTSNLASNRSTGKLSLEESLAGYPKADPAQERQRESAERKYEPAFPDSRKNLSRYHPYLPPALQKAEGNPHSSSVMPEDLSMKKLFPADDKWRPWSKH